MATVTAPVENTIQTGYRVQANYVEACSCNHGCNCQFAGHPNEGFCEFLMCFEITNGHFGQVPLEGLQVVLALAYPGAIHEGRGRLVPFVNESATNEQIDALAQILSGKHGGMPWEALSNTLVSVAAPTRAPIEFDAQPQRARVKVANAVDLQLTPLLNPVTKAEKEVHIVYPKGGFFWNDGAIATTERMQVNCAGIRFEHPGRYAATSTINWTNGK